MSDRENEMENIDGNELSKQSAIENKCTQGARHSEWKCAAEAAARGACGLHVHLLECRE